MPTPIHFLVEHQYEILSAFAASQEKPKKTWSLLLEILPELSNAMQFNTFKQYVRVFAVFSGELDKIRQDLSTVKQKLDKTKAQNHSLLEELAKVRQLENGREKVAQKFDKHPKRISGWSVQRSKDGYLRCYRKIEGRVYSIYIGKHFQAEKTQKRIMEKEKSLGLLNTENCNDAENPN